MLSLNKNYFGVDGLICSIEQVIAPNSKKISECKEAIKSASISVSSKIEDGRENKESVWLKQQPTILHKFFRIPSAKEQILTLAKYAGPLDKVNYYIRKAYAQNESHLKETLLQALHFAAVGLDLTIRDKDGKQLDKGRVEELLELITELFPNDLPQAVDMIRRAAPLEDKKDSEIRENAKAKMNQLFNAFVQNDKVGLPAAIKTFNKFIERSKPEMIIDNRYYLNLLYLVLIAFDLLQKRERELPLIDGEHSLSSCAT
jgi:hypothetical protein